MLLDTTHPTPLAHPSHRCRACNQRIAEVTAYLAREEVLRRTGRGTARVREIRRLERRLKDFYECDVARGLCFAFVPRHQGDPACTCGPRTTTTPAHPERRAA